MKNNNQNQSPNNVNNNEELISDELLESRINQLRDDIENLDFSKEISEEVKEELNLTASSLLVNLRTFEENIKNNNMDSIDKSYKIFISVSDKNNYYKNETNL